jgi:hypothetical protein
MPFFTPSPPITEDERAWIESSMLRLIKLFGFETLRSRPTILPDPGFFPERYMSQPMFGYALAGYCWMRGEKKPPWERLMTANVREPFRRSMKYLVKTGKTELPAG